MLRLLKFLKPFVFHIILAFILLFIMANADLALPDYLSRIVNIGIQRSGIEDAVPEAIRQEQMERLFLFMTADERSQVEANYTLVEKSDPAYQDMLTSYPLLADKAVYTLNKIDPETRDQLNLIMGKAFTIVQGINQMVENPESSSAMLGGALPIDMTQIPAGMDIFSVFKMMPKAQRTQITAMIDEKVAAVGVSMVEQVAVVGIKAEYEALGMNLATYQTNYILKVGGLMLLMTALAGVCRPR